MSEQNQKRPGGRGPFGSGPMGGLVEKPKDFKGTFRRLSHYLAPEKYRFVAVFFLAIASTLFSIVGPKVMGKATTKLAEGSSPGMPPTAGFRRPWPPISRRR